MYQNLVEELKNRESFILLIDGMCGSGKTTLALSLKDKLDTNVVSIDNYYLPFNLREENWYELSGGNINYDRLIKEVINPYLNKEELNLKRYNPHNDTYEEIGIFKYKPRLIIEGSYSFIEDLRKYSDYNVFLKCDKSIQDERLKKRELDNYQNFKDRWVKKEELYFKDKNPFSLADLIIDTSDLF